MHGVMTLIGRILLALIFVVSGLHKIGGYSGTQAYMESMGVPGELLPLVIALEVGAGALVMAGWYTWIAAWSLAAFTLLAALIFHMNLADQMQFIQFMKNLAITGGFLVLAAHGPGPLSVDARRGA